VPRPKRGADRAGELVVPGAGGRWPMAERSLLATVLGVPPLAAVGLAAVLTGVGVLVDLTRAGTLGTVFTICYVVGCLLAVAWVRRNGLFAPMVQPPLLLAVAVPAVVLLAGTPKPGAGVAERLLVIGAPLVNSFPTMAWTTGLAVALGVVRLVVQRPQREKAADKGRTGTKRPVRSRRGSRSGAGDAARGATRTSGSPPRS
jgi:hypothetical protein